MPSTLSAPAPSKSSYKRPSKTRAQRRKDDRRKYDDSSDRRFLWRVLVLVGLLAAVAVGFVVRGTKERAEAEAAGLVHAAE